MSDRVYRVAFTPRARKQLAKLDKQTVRRVQRFFGETLDLADPRSRGKPLRSREEWRYRVGDHRILCRIDDEEIVVLVVTVAHRREVYRR